MQTTYQLENLGADRFQMLCQALIAVEYPGAVLFPTGERDGGRDALWRGSRDNVVVFQVKYTSHPDRITDPYKWVEDAFRGELSKVRELAALSTLSRYVIVTNVKGTAALGSGSIDAVDRLLTEELGVPASCWWRNDIERRIDSNSSVKWSYPAIVSAEHLYGALIESSMDAAQRSRRSRAFLAFLQAQHDEDQRVRFKQVELDQPLLRMFVDVPASLSQVSKDANSSDERLFRYLSIQEERLSPDHSPALSYYRGGAASMRRRYSPDTPHVGAAFLLLDGTAVSGRPRVLLEGAPGQGKSTLTQFVCEVHRIRLLGLDSSALPRTYIDSPVRLPFRIELRTLATWLSEGRGESIEEFLADQVASNSGGASFSVDDLQAIIGDTESLLVLDGLDEIADIDQREEVARSIERTTSRLTAIARSLVVVVTSRPNAYVQSNSLSVGQWWHLRLDELSSRHVYDYAEKWIELRNLDGKQSSDIRTILEEKLEEPHMADLARNPMQLAILLSLIHSLGPALPDRRTALYSRYMGLFLDREADKDRVVAEHRDLLLEIHGYVAWHLQIEAEARSGAGRIALTDLKELIRTFLDREGHDSSLADLLWEGARDRVYALVSRVQGHFEFEVQPLREFFCAHYLYETAPRYTYRQQYFVGLPERFESVAKNPYWTNVARFLAGFFNKGEQPSILFALESALDVESLNARKHVVSVAFMIMGDWSLSQSPRPLERLVEDIALPEYFRSVLGAYRMDIPSVSEPNARRFIADRLGPEFLGASNGDYLTEIAALLGEYGDPGGNARLWLEKCASGVRGELAADAAALMGILEQPIHEVIELLASLDSGHSRLLGTRAPGRIDDQLSSLIVDDLLDRGAGLEGMSVEELEAHPVWSFALAIRLLVALPSDRYPHFGRKSLKDISGMEFPEAGGAVSNWCRAFLVDARPDFVAISDGVADFGSWDRTVESARQLFGDRPTFFTMANAAALVRASYRGGGAGDLLDASTSLAARVRHARYRQSDRAWWKSQLEASSSSSPLVATTILLWARPGVVRELSGSVRSEIEGLCHQHFDHVIRSIVRLGSAVDRATRRSGAVKHAHWSRQLGARTQLALHCRYGGKPSEAGLRRMAGELRGSSQALGYLLLESFRIALKDPTYWRAAVDVADICKGLEDGASTPFWIAGLPSDVELLSERFARKVLEEPRDASSLAFSLANSSLTRADSWRPRPVDEIAAHEGWWGAVSEV